MALEVEGTCPDCGGTLGLRITDSIAILAKSQIEQMMDKDENAIRCSTCDEYTEPEDMSIEE